MTGRGRYAKGVAKREEILRTALEVFSRQGYRGSSLRELAAAVNLSQAGLLHYFDSKEELFAEILRKRDELDDEAYTAPGDALGTMVAVMRHNAEVPGLVKLYTTISAAATEPDHPAHPFFVRRYEEMRQILAESIRTKQESGELDTKLDAEKLAAIMLAVADGMQLQWQFDSRHGMADHVEYLWSVLTGVEKLITR
ncbi:helix-turn-helix domain-containing protein [Saxibacter everestensis]|uniref:Helix-turn-helix domain-containing protein n=1 Tax=Saxibacter everestensis TaxID=2909229 RepID=A0ABY8QVP8_9MICO|nr:helix-turn-helix domain-containing protein [Brevibacteriaceae bacterium ZFBP1038]